jgi:Na+/H+ antiporter NhaD/arsenite permease-like protein
VERRDGIEELSTLLAVGVATLFAVLAFIYMLYRWSRKRERLRRERKKTQGTSDAQTGQAIIRMVFDDM